MTIKCLNCGCERDTLNKRTMFCTNVCAATYWRKHHRERHNATARRAYLRKKMANLRATGKIQCKRCRQPFIALTTRTKYCYDPHCRLMHKRESWRAWSRKHGKKPRAVIVETQQPGIRDIQHSAPERAQKLIDRLIAGVA